MPPMPASDAKLTMKPMPLALRKGWAAWHVKSVPLKWMA